MDESIKDAILTIMDYIKAETGVEPTQEEVAALLKSYFILNEVGNQIKYQLKKEAAKPGGAQNEAHEPFWQFNLKTGPGRNNLAKTGIFHRSIKEAIDSIRQHVQKTIGADPDYDIIAQSLKSNFILSEIKNQLDYQRKES
jgi:primase-polymerase (primpol)-like protein